MVMSATSRAMAAPSRMAMPASALGERRGVVHAVAEHDHAPSASCSRRMKLALPRAGPRSSTRSTPTAAATDFAVRSLSPVIITSFVKPRERSPRDDVGSLRAQRVLNADDRREHTGLRRDRDANTPPGAIQTFPLPPRG